jgi:hypothetical protein
LQAAVVTPPVVETGDEQSSVEAPPFRT